VTWRIALLAALAPASQVDRLAWMAGCWSLRSGTAIIEEHWTQPAGGAMLGLSRTLKDGRMVFHEFMRIEEQGSALVFTARASATPVAFRAAVANESEVVFENPAHDFPQRITYRRQTGALDATLEGKDRGKERMQRFPYTRAVCP
jgi:hypothetical protein